MLSDGMGSGENAFVKSQQIVDLLEQLLMAGFCRELAIELLNSFISFLTDGKLSSTLDLTMIDFYTGTADFIKLGASTTFIKRGKKVECIRSTSLPVGVLEQVEFDTCKRLLYHGDIVVMVSDGIMDGIIFENKEEYLADLIGGMDTCNAQTMAEAIMEAVEDMHQTGLKDDSTVLVAGVWNR
jgi:stage II sporulation protein E